MGRAVLEICSQTDRQTDRHGHIAILGFAIEGGVKVIAYTRTVTVDLSEFAWAQNYTYATESVACF